MAKSEHELKNILLETLSFYEAYSLERILIEIDRNFVESHEALTMDDLDEALKSLKKEGKVSIFKKKSEKLYKKRFPKRSLRNRFLRWWEGLK